MPTPLSLVASAITIVLGAVVAFSFFFGDDGEFDILTEDFFITTVATLVLLAAPVALLLSWDEVDVSALGTATLGMAIYADTDGGIGPMLTVAVVGIVIGAVVGLVRWATRAPSALVSLAGGAVASAIAFQIFDGGMQGARVGDFDPQWFSVLAALVVVAAGVGLALVAALLRRPAPVAALGDPPAAGRPHVGVVAGFALAGGAACLSGAVQAGLYGFAQVTMFSTSMLVSLFAAVAIAGVTRKSGLLAPVLAIVGAFLVAVLELAGRPGPFDSDRDLALAGLLAAGVAIAHGLARISDGRDGPRPHHAPGAPPAVAGPAGATAGVPAASAPGAGWPPAPGHAGAPPVAPPPGAPQDDRPPPPSG